MSNAVTTLARGSAGNKYWGPALATLIGVTSDAIKSIGMKHHISFGLNLKSNVPHVPSNRLMKINNCWSKISKSTRSKKFDFVLEYEKENGVKIKEAVTEYSVGLIFAIINNKDGSKAEKFTRKLQKKDHQGKRKSDDDQEYRGRREMWSGKSSEQPKGNKAHQSSGGKYQRSAPQSSGGKYQKSALGSDSSDSASDSEAIAEEESEIQTEKFELPKIEIETADDPFDDSTAPEVIPIIMYPCKGHFSDDSSTDSFYFSDSDDQLEFPSKASPQDDQTSSQPIEERPNMEGIVSSTTELVSGPTVPTSSILVKHGTEHPAEVGDKDSKGAKKMASLKSTDDTTEQYSVVTVMGHVGYGKTSVLDAPSSRSVAANEAGEYNKHPATLAKNIDNLQHASKEFAKEEAQDVQADKFSKPMVDYDSVTIAQGESEMHNEYCPKGRATIPTSSILVKHGTKRPVEVGDKDSKVAKKMASPKSTHDETE